MNFFFARRMTIHGVPTVSIVDEYNRVYAGVASPEVDPLFDPSGLRLRALADIVAESYTVGHQLAITKKGPKPLRLVRRPDAKNALSVVDSEGRFFAALRSSRLWSWLPGATRNHKRLLSIVEYAYHNGWSDNAREDDFLGSRRVDACSYTDVTLEAPDRRTVGVLQ